MSVDYDIYKGTPKGRNVHGPYDRWTSVCATRAASLACTPQQPVGPVLAAVPFVA